MPAEERLPNTMRQRERRKQSQRDSRVTKPRVEAHGDMIKWKLVTNSCRKMKDTGWISGAMVQKTPKFEASWDMGHPKYKERVGQSALLQQG